ncbi:MAG TPA: hypothetical protein GX733_08615 [Tissierellia bacterium]|nr:hypothetical protein [Tissierellia bacterium]
MGTDDGRYPEFIGEEVVLMPGEVRNLKITYPKDRRWL